MNIQDDRRRALKYGAATGLSLALPTAGYARCCRLSFSSLLKLHVGRLAAGLVFDLVAPVLVKATREGMHALFSGSSYSSGYYSSTGSVASLSDGAGVTGRAEYKAAVVHVGVADWEEDQRRQVRLLLANALDEQRFSSIRDYLRHEKINIKLADGVVSDSVGHDLEPDDLFTADYWVMGDEQQSIEHCRRLEEITGSQVFKEWGVSS